MGKSKFEVWAAAQATAMKAERHLATAADEWIAGLRSPPTELERQYALIARAKATASLMELVSEVGEAQGERPARPQDGAPVGQEAALGSCRSARGRT